LRSVSPAKGKFRSFLIASLKNFLANEWDKSQTLKRGGRFSLVPFDSGPGETRYREESALDMTPDKAFEQRWALALLDKVLQQLREEYDSAGKINLFGALQPYLSGDGGLSYAQMAAGLGLTESAVKMAVLRMRRRFGELLRAEVALTVSAPEEIDEEIRDLFAAVSR
jgi:RNA polymerase sigma-70 factor (ECF subfamily)